MLAFNQSIEFWIGHEKYLQAGTDKDIEYACQHEISQIPLVASKEWRLGELLVKNA